MLRAIGFESDKDILDIFGLANEVKVTKTNLKKRMEAESGACEDKFRLARLAKEQNLDAVHDTVHEMAKDEARHGAGFQGLYKRYFGK